jgi:hypothetical protein
VAPSRRRRNRLRRGARGTATGFRARGGGQAFAPWVTAARQVPTRFGGQRCGGLVRDLAGHESGRATPVRTALAARRRLHHPCAFPPRCGADRPPPNNRLQGMRGRAWFRPRKGLRAGPAPLTLVPFGRQDRKRTRFSSGLTPHVGGLVGGSRCHLLCNGGWVLDRSRDGNSPD